MNFELTYAGRKFSELEQEKQVLLLKHRPTTDAEWQTFAALSLEIMGMRNAVRMGDARLWRHAIAELDGKPLPPLNLPLSIWEAYEAHPYTAATLRLDCGATIPITDWSQVYYCWHSRRCAVDQNEQFCVFQSTRIISVETTPPAVAQINILEKLNWLQHVEPFVPFAVRTRQGLGLIVRQLNNFNLDDSGLILAVYQGEKSALEIIPVADIVSIHTPKKKTSDLWEQLNGMLRASPFAPICVHFVTGRSYTIHRPNDAILTCDELHLGTGPEGAKHNDRVIKLELQWLDKIEGVPPEA